MGGGGAGLGTVYVSLGTIGASSEPFYVLRVRLRPSPDTLCPAETRSGTPLNRAQGSNPVAATVAAPEQV